MSRIERVVKALFVVCITCSCITGCTEDIADSISVNSKVINNMKQYAKDRYGADVEIDHVLRRGGISSTREYIADVNIGNENYMFTGKYDSDGSYESTRDTVIDSVINDREYNRVNELMGKIFDDYRVEVSANTSVNNECNFGKIPTYEELVDGKYLDSTSSESVIGIVYCDLENIKNDLRGKTKEIREILNTDIKTQVALYLVDMTDKERVERFTSNNDLVSILAVFNSSNKLDTKLDCCTNVIRFGTTDYDRMERVGIQGYIEEIKKNDKNDKRDNGKNNINNKSVKEAMDNNDHGSEDAGSSVEDSTKESRG